MSEWIVGATYTREELNAMMGVAEDCDCRIVTDNHVCEE